MGNPLFYTSGNLQAMNSSGLDWLRYLILSEFASSNSGTGTLNTSGIGFAIGTFSDTKRQDAIGSHPVGTSVTTLSTTVYQELNSVSESSIVHPVHYNGTNIQAQDTNGIDSIIDIALTSLVNSGIGSYTMQPTAPTGGTWQSVFTITNTLVDGSSNQTTIWRKINDTAPAEYKPLKTSGSNLQIMTDIDIKTLVQRLRNRIVNDGVGQYSFGTTPPATGTWVRVGSQFSDTRYQVGNVTYTGSYTGTYAGNYTGTYTGYYQLFYGNRPGPTYAGNYTGTYTGYYTGTYTGNYTGLTVLNSTETVSTVSLWVRTA